MWIHYFFCVISPFLDIQISSFCIFLSPHFFCGSKNEVCCVLGSKWPLSSHHVLGVFQLEVDAINRLWDEFPGFLRYSSLIAQLKHYLATFVNFMPVFTKHYSRNWPKKVASSLNMTRFSSLWTQCRKALTGERRVVKS